MAKPTVYRYDDTNAPVADYATNPNCLKDIFKACLIEGYGSGESRKEPPGGWEIAKETDTQLILRNIAENGFNGAISLSFIHSKKCISILCADDFSEDGTAITPWASHSMDSDFIETYYHLGWSIVATGTGFYFLGVKDIRYKTDYALFDATCPWKNSYLLTFFFGEMVAVHPEDNFAALGIQGYKYKYGFTTVPYNTATEKAGLWASRKRNSGLPTSANSYKLVGQGVPCSDFYMPLAGETIAVVSRLIFCDLGSSLSLRGFFPGLYFPLENCRDLDNLQEITIEDRRFLFVKGTVYNASSNNFQAYLVSLDDWEEN